MPKTRSFLYHFVTDKIKKSQENSSDSEQHSDRIIS